MATARVPRFYAGLSSLDAFTTSSPYCLLLPLRSQRRPTNHTARIARKPPQLPGRQFSTPAASMSEPIAPPQQEVDVKAQPEQTLQEHEPTTSDTISEEPSALVASTPLPSTPAANAATTTSSDPDFLTTSRRITGTVIRTHTMAKTVAVSTNRQRFDRFLQKHYSKPTKTLVHDPNKTLVAGDVIEYGVFPPVERAERIKMGKGKRVKYVVREVVTPFATPLDQRVPRGGAGQGQKELDS